MNDIPWPNKTSDKVSEKIDYVLPSNRELKKSPPSPKKVTAMFHFTFVGESTMYTLYTCMRLKTQANQYYIDFVKIPLPYHWNKNGMLQPL